MFFMVVGTLGEYYELGRWPFVVLYGSITFLLLYEYAQMLIVRESASDRGFVFFRRAITMLLGGLPFVLVAQNRLNNNFLERAATELLDGPMALLRFMRAQFELLLDATLLGIAFLFVLFIVELFSKSKRPFYHLGSIFLGFIYIGIPMQFLLWLKPAVVMSILLMVWLNDTMAYIVGSQIGRRKLFPSISPNKTWEGTLGGVLAAILTGVVCHYSWEAADLSLQDGIALGLIVGVFGNLGDLVESMLKRSVEVKDSGSLLPGHGGFLDRFDAFLFVLPFVMVYLYVIERYL